MGASSFRMARERAKAFLEAEKKKVEEDKNKKPADGKPGKKDEKAKED